MSEMDTARSIAALAALERHLREQLEHGVERVHLSPTALADLSSLQAGVARVSPTRQPSPPPIAAQARPATGKQEPPLEPPPQTAKPAAKPPAATEKDAAENRARLREIALRAKGCSKVRSLGSLRDQFVFAAGNPVADLMFVGEAPGMEEEKVHRPFVGPAGQLLDKIIKVMGFERDEVYISNIVKFRPSTGTANQGASNRKPTAEEMAASVGYVIEEIGVVQPKVIVALGGTAMEGLLGLEGGVARNRSQFHSLRGIPVMVTYHPSYLLRTPELAEKRKVWEDMLLVLERLEMPISPQQRRYFL